MPILYKTDVKSETKYPKFFLFTSILHKIASLYVLLHFLCFKQALWEEDEGDTQNEDRMEAWRNMKSLRGYQKMGIKKYGKSSRLGLWVLKKAS